MHQHAGHSELQDQGGGASGTHLHQHDGHPVAHGLEEGVREGHAQPVLEALAANAQLHLAHLVFVAGTAGFGLDVCQGRLHGRYPSCLDGGVGGTRRERFQRRTKVGRVKSRARSSLPSCSTWLWICAS